jgi:hypothetical protein
MNQEHKFVCLLFHSLAQFIDPEKPIYISLDGEAAKKGVQEKLFLDPNVPDLWFSFVGIKQNILLEAKVLDTANRIKLSQNQINAWKTKGGGNHKPNGWVCRNEALDKFYYWKHECFIDKIDNNNSNADYPKKAKPKQSMEFNKISELAMFILTEAKDKMQ